MIRLGLTSFRTVRAGDVGKKADVQYIPHSYRPQFLLHAEFAAEFKSFHLSGTVGHYTGDGKKIGLCDRGTVRR